MAMKPEKITRIIQISDTHLYDDANKDLLGVKTQASFASLTQLLRNDPKKIDLIIVSGDLSQDGKQHSYQRIAEQLGEFKVPVYCIPGNHDNVSEMTAAYPHESMLADKHVILENWDVILLNSQKPGCVEGHLDSLQMHFLESCLSARADYQALVVLHHHPVPVGSAWLDKIGLENAESFWTVIKGHPRVKAVLFGHVHQEFAGKVSNTLCYSAPSTCIQFKRLSEQFALEPLGPGYRWLDLYADGRMETGVCRVPEYIGEFQADAKGY